MRFIARALAECGLDVDAAFADQVRGPQVARPPRDRAVKQHLAVRAGDRGGELCDGFRRVWELGRAAHRQVDVLHAQLADDGALVELHLVLHFFRRAEVDDGRHALVVHLAQRALGGLSGDEEIVADAHGRRLEAAGRVERNGRRESGDGSGSRDSLRPAGGGAIAARARRRAAPLQRVHGECMRIIDAVLGQEMRGKT